MTRPDGRRLLLVHAHPDDETITTGATMAAYAAGGAVVTLVTCTLGEEGEILVPELAGLESARADQLGGYRIGELTAAMHALGVADHRFLGGAGRYRDSGMIGTPPNDHPRAFWRADRDRAVFDDAVAQLVAIVREVRPQIVVTYDPDGDYGHPDHIMAHRVTTAAVQLAADAAHGGGEPWQVAKLYWTASPVSVLRADAVAVAARPDLPFAPLPVHDLPFGVDDAVVTTVVRSPSMLAPKVAALAAHRTQISVAETAGEPLYALSNGLGRRVLGTEHFRLVGADPFGTDETDLFEGVTS